MAASTIAGESRGEEGKCREEWERSGGCVALTAASSSSGKQELAERVRTRRGHTPSCLLEGG